MPVDVSGANGDRSAVVGLEALGGSLRITDTAKVEVRVSVVSDTVERTVQVAVAGASAVRARLRGPKAALEALDEKTLRGRPQASAKGVVLLIENLPAGVELLDPAPAGLRLPSRTR
jgi:hypothetical protein